MKHDQIVDRIIEKVKKKINHELDLEIAEDVIFDIVDYQFGGIAKAMRGGVEIQLPMFGTFAHLYKVEYSKHSKWVAENGGFEAVKKDYKVKGEYESDEVYRTDAKKTPSYVMKMKIKGLCEKHKKNKV